MPSSLLVRTVFGLLVIATTGAFFITQRLKRSPPPIERVYYRDVFSPNSDGRRDTIGLRFRLRAADRATVSILDEAGEEVRRLADGRPLPAGPHNFRWNGRTDDGAVAADGAYRLRVALLSQGRSLTVPRTMRVDTEAPTPRLVGAAPAVVVPGTAQAGAGVRIRYRAPRVSSAPLFRVFRTDRRRPVQVDAFRGRRLAQAARWDARTGRRAAPAGTYAFSITVRDKAGNAGTGPAPGRPAAGPARPGTGITVLRAGVAGPLEPVLAGRGARFRLAGPPRRVRWSFTRLGGRRPLARGRDFGAALFVRVPRRARTGVHLLRVSSGGGRALFPVAVRRAAPPRAPLVVLPAITWEGRNAVDDDRDGFPDTLETAPSVALGRPLARGRLPRGFSAGAGPLLRELDRARLRYELTTDLALARGRGPRLRGRPGVVFAGDERWLPEALNLRLRDYAERGGRVASFGADAFRRRVRVESGRLRDPGAPEPVNVLGERTAPAAVAPGPLTVFSDRVGLFPAGAVGRFTRLEESRGLPAGAEVLAAAGRDPARPAFVAYRLRRGLVVRAGAPGFGRLAAEQPGLARLTRAVWALISR